VKKMNGKIHKLKVSFISGGDLIDAGPAAGRLQDLAGGEGTVKAMATQAPKAK
jgi:hypothetical protein